VKKTEYFGNISRLNLLARCCLLTVCAGVFCVPVVHTLKINDMHHLCWEDRQD